MPGAPFYISPFNPNSDQGGGDLCYPHKQVEDVKGPWVVFPAVDVAEAQGTLSLPHASVPVSFLKAALAEAEGVEWRETTNESITDKINAQPEPDFDFADLPQEDQERLLEVMPGERARFDFGVVQVPGGGPAQAKAELAEVRGELLPSEEPGDKPGEYVRVPDEDEAPAI